jgi:uncharacterized membrane protein YgdD (TMEM256/DUF423 family)
MHLVFDIFQGIGVAAAVGIRPFLPALAVGALGAGDVQIDFAHHSLSFLQKPAFLLVMFILAVLLALAERRLSRQQMEGGPPGLLIAAAALAVGALLFAGALSQGGYAIWPGIVGGVICAGVGILATRPLVRRVRARLDAESVGALPLFTEAAALLAAVLSVLLPPVGIVVLGLLLWLLFAGRARGDEKYAGLRILR